MKNAFLIPALTAAALHAVFLFSFNEPSVVLGDDGIFIDPPNEDFPEWPPMEIAVTTPDEVVDVSTDTDTPDDTPLPVDDIIDQPAEDLPPVELETPSPVPTEVIHRIADSDFTHVVRPGKETSHWRESASDRFSAAINFGQLDRIPETRLRVSPRYPERMRRDGVEAEVIITFVVDTQGRVVEARADERAPWEFAREAEKAVLRWRFEPGTRKGRPVSFRMSVPLLFAIRDA
ncbi:energy transducer TonB [Actomonas aquatica]|uniref:TonB family protein n=1 Tax=Actomonas aquatica TaxID=2866162 RepID=A0ABZ1CCX9_9BACT|nr:energy transducer TonB [Opitutus sp. WL0086]WRQ88155.1 TonB family protein [Opitutus sp. WL0086]